jgi:hypothetical protein
MSIISKKHTNPVKIIKTSLLKNIAKSIKRMEKNTK